MLKCSAEIAKPTALVDRESEIVKLEDRVLALCSVREIETEKLEDPSQLRKTKKDIARIKTVMRQREIEQGEMEQGEMEQASKAK